MSEEGAVVDAENRLRIYRLEAVDERRRNRAIERAWKIEHAGRQVAMFMALVGLSQVLLTGLVTYSLGIPTAVSNAVVLSLLGLGCFIGIALLIAAPLHLRKMRRIRV